MSGVCFPLAAFRNMLPHFLWREWLGNLYEWMINRRKGIRLLHVIFAILFGSELTIGAWYWVNAKTMESQIAVISGIGAIILSTTLVYSNLVQTSALRFLGVLVEPWDGNLADEYKTTVVTPSPWRDSPGLRFLLPQAAPRNVRRFPRIIRQIECTTRPSQLKVADDIANIGYRDTNIHEYAVDVIPGSNLIYPIRETIGPQSRRTLSRVFPTDGAPLKGFYEGRITARAATQQLSESFWIWVSPDGRIIRWCSKKRSLEKISQKASDKEA